MERPKVGLAVILMNNCKVLLGKRENAHGAGTWCFPGGHLDPLEGFKNCAERELREETGLDAIIPQDAPCAVTNDIFREEDKHYVTLFIQAEYIRGEPKIMEPKKCKGWRWFEWHELIAMYDELFLPIQNLITQGYNPFSDL